MYRNNRVAIIVPAYNEEGLIRTTLESMPQYVDQIIAINDCSQDDTLKIMIECAKQDTRIIVINHNKNLGVGGAIKSGFAQFIHSDSHIMVIMAGDNQMDPAYLPSIIDPLVQGSSDIVKGNRLGRNLCQGMSLWRYSGNILLTYLSKIATGYYDVNDPQNGYVGATKVAISSMDIHSLYNGYSFENDFMTRARIAGLRMKNADIPARYGKEVSGIKYGRFIMRSCLFLTRSFLFRIRIMYLNGKPSYMSNATKDDRQNMKF